MAFFIAMASLVETKFFMFSYFTIKFRLNNVLTEEQLCENCQNQHPREVSILRYFMSRGIGCQWITTGIDSSIVIYQQRYCSKRYGHNLFIMPNGLRNAPRLHMLGPLTKSGPLTRWRDLRTHLMFKRSKNNGSIYWPLKPNGGEGTFAMNYAIVLRIATTQMKCIFWMAREKICPLNGFEVYCFPTVFVFVKEIQKKWSHMKSRVTEKWS